MASGIHIILSKEDWEVPNYLEKDEIKIKNFFGGKKLRWKLAQKLYSKQFKKAAHFLIKQGIQGALCLGRILLE